MLQEAKDEHGEWIHYGLKMDPKTFESRLKSDRGGIYSIGATEQFKIPIMEDLSARGDIKPLEKDSKEFERATKKNENIFSEFTKSVWNEDKEKFELKTFKNGRMTGVDLFSSQADGKGTAFFQKREKSLRKNVIEYLNNLRKIHPSVKNLPKVEDMDFFYGRTANDEEKTIQYSISARLDKDNWKIGGLKYFDMESKDRLEAADGDKLLLNRCKFMAAAYDQINVTWFERDGEKVYRIKVVPQITQIALAPDTSSPVHVVTPDEFDEVKLSLSNLIERKSKDESNPGPQDGKISAIVQNNGRNLTIEIRGEFRINKDKEGNLQNNGVFIFHDGHHGEEIKNFINNTMTDMVIESFLDPENKKILKNFKKKKPTREYLRDQGNSYVRHPQDEDGEEDESRPPNYKINLGREMEITMANENDVNTLSREEFNELVADTGVEVTAKLTYTFIVFGKSDWSNKPRAISMHIHRKMSRGDRGADIEDESGFDLFGDAPDCVVSKESVDDGLESPEE